ncbi:MAG: ricin-type beta-trefoil lectin domain protein [Lewinellaceae bacterium]|nr:ricin-type beta-trefoil lectin domain protein [Lewinellaceae bacterium]
MKDNNSFFQFYTNVLPMLGLLFFGSAVQLSAQVVPFHYEGHYHDYVIPQTTDQYIVLTAVGGDGGSIRFKNAFKDFTVGGGSGAFLKSYFKIGTASNNLKPGSTLRFMVGGGGESRQTAGSTGAGGGGGTGIAYKEVGTQTWTLLMVAGGGSGAAFDLIEGRTYGEPGLAYSQGTEGDGKGGLSDPEQGGGAGAFGDDEQHTAGSSTIKYGNHAKAGWSGGPNAGEPTGGYCDDTGPQGGWGFGAGGDGNTASGYAGGGGGYTGGNANDGDYSNTAGTSYLNTSKETAFVLSYGQGTTTSAQPGYASLELVGDSPVKSIRFAYNSNLCIQNNGNSTSNGSNIETHNWLGTNAQKWYFNPEDRSVRSQLNIAKCVDLSNNNTSNGNNIQLWDCNGSTAQKWVYNGIFKTIHSGSWSDKCLDAKYGINTPSSGVNVQLYDCEYTNNNQKWFISGATTVSNPANVKHIVPVIATGFAVHSHTGAESGSNIQLWTKDNTNEYEQWYFDGLAIKMRNHQNLCIDLSQSNTNNGNNIQLWGCNGTDAQKWIYDGMTKSIRSVINPDKCMQIEYNTDGAYGKRANVDIYDCNGSAAQLFLIQE